MMYAVTPQAHSAPNSHSRSSLFFRHNVVRTGRGRRYRRGKPSTLFQKFYLTLILMGCSQFADGHSYSKNKMDEILRSGALDKLPPRQKESHPHVKREDVELIVSRKLERADGNPLERGTDTNPGA